MTSSCDQLQRLGALVDGELPPAEARALSVHAAGCAVCAAELDELRAMTRMMSAVRRGGIGAMPDDVMGRLRVHVQGLVEQADVGLVWMARIFSGVAASVLIVGLWMLNAPAPSGVAVAPSGNHAVLGSAITLTIDPPAAVQAPDLRLPESVLDDLAGTNLSSAAGVTENELP